MSSDSKPNASLKPDEAEGPSGLFAWVNKINDVLRFSRTRTAILNNEPLYDYAKKQLDSISYRAQYLGCQLLLSRRVHIS